MKLPIIILSSLTLSSLSAAVPLKWTVETSRVQPVTFDVVRGETITLEAALQSYGKPLAMDGKAVSIFYQTNGMNNAWWTAPASAASNRLTATFTPAMDPGGATVSGFIGTTGEIYRAAWTLRFRKGPGATPNAIALPTPTLDLANTVILNAPWPTIAALDERYTSKAEGSSVAYTANQALLYAHGTYQYMTGNKNAWLEGTNYVSEADGTVRTKFTWEQGMNAATVPCSMSLWEVRNGATNVVWDARDWTVWYWNFKSAQMSNALASATSELAADVRDNYMRRGFAKYTAVNGLDNPDPKTLWIDTEKIQLAAGHQWQRLVEVGGAGYWTITGNGIEVGSPSATNSFLTISDFEGNAAFTFRKTDAYQVYAKTGSDITGQYRDAQGRIVFTVVAPSKPTAEFTTVLDTSTFVEQDAEGCPADYEWTVSETPGAYDCHFLLKPGITSNACFARFKITVEGENIIENAVPMKMTGGIVVEQYGVKYKIRPKVSGNTVTWEVVQ